MLGIELSALSAAEVNRLLEVARSRGNAALERQLVAELAARRKRHAGWTTDSLQFVRVPEPGPAPARLAPRPALLGLAATAVVALAVGWGVSVELAPRLGSPPTPAPARVMLARTTPVAAAPPPVVEAPAPPAAPAPRATSVHHNPCLNLPTPGERLVCGYPSLAAQDRQVTAAFDRAMASASDPDAVERAQSAWRQARDGTWDRTELADLNARRLEELAAPPAPAP